MEEVLEETGCASYTRSCMYQKNRGRHLTSFCTRSIRPEARCRLGLGDEVGTSVGTDEEACQTKSERGMKVVIVLELVVMPRTRKGGGKRQMMSPEWTMCS